MLQHYSPYKVAENFNVLASLAPGRVDLGIGRGPGGMPSSTKALQQEMGNGVTPLSEKLIQLEQFLHNRLEETHPLYGLQTSPQPPQPADLFLLGTTPASAEMAAALGMPYVFALFLNNNDRVMYESVATYRQQFDGTKGTSPQAILALPVIVADTDAEAQHYASEIKMVRIRLQSGRTFTVGTLEAAEEFAKQSQEAYTIEVQEGNSIHGSRDTVQKTLHDIQSRYQVDELMIVTAIRNFQKRLHSYELLKDVFQHDAKVVRSS